MDEKPDLIIAGRKIGTYSGWGQQGDMAFQFYDFEPIPGLAIPASVCLYLEYGAGKLSNDMGEWDLIDTLRDLPKP